MVYLTRACLAYSPIGLRADCGVRRSALLASNGGITGFSAIRGQAYALNSSLLRDGSVRPLQLVDAS